MGEKSHVSMETAVCPACGKEHDTGTILLDRRLRQSLERKTCTHWALCPEHKQQVDDGFVLLVGIDPDKSKYAVGDNMLPQDVYRTGDIVAIKEHAFNHVFNAVAPPRHVAFVEPAVITRLQTLARELST